MSVRSYLVFLLAGIICVPAFSSSPDLQIIRSLSNNQQWLKLLHYEGNKSRADGLDYFLSGIKGKTDPYAETLATYLAFKNKKITGRLKSIAPCTFPARYQIFQKFFPQEFKSEKCYDYDQWLRSLDTSSVSIIFASSYEGNPASTFGHTFLRLNRKEKVQDQSDLLDYGLNFAATTGSDGGIEFAFLGLLGFYPGHFSLLPYFMKVNEYSHMENRNLYEYKLKLNAEEISLLLAQVWEIENTTFFDYYFFDENCSYLLLMMIDGLKPEMGISRDLKIFVTPLDTLKILGKHSLITLNRVNYSLDDKIKTMEEDLSDDERDEFYSALKDQRIPEDVKVLDILAQYYFNEIYRTRAKISKAERSFYERILISRSTIKNNQEIIEKPFVLPESQNVLKGHDSNSFSMGIFSQDQLISLFQWRFGIHGLEDRDRGYLAFSSLEAIKPTLAYNWNEGKIYLKEFNFVSALSLQASTWHKIHPNWRFNISWLGIEKRAHSIGNGVSVGEIGGGLSSESFWQSRIYLHVLGVLARDSGAETTRAAPVLEMGWVIPVMESQKIILKWREKFQNDDFVSVQDFSSHGSLEHSLYLSDQSALLTQVDYAIRESELSGKMLLRFYY